jgi:hypothetical protein
MNATAFKKILIFFIFVVVIVTAAGFYYGLGEIKKLAIQVNNKVEDSKASGRQIDELRRLQQTLLQSDTLVQKANRMFSTEASFTSDVVRDLERYASVSGVTIVNRSFVETSEVQGVIDSNQLFIRISLAQPVSYASLLRFIQLIEGNIPKMQLNSLTIARPDQPSGDTVTVGEITIGVSVR